MSTAGRVDTQQTRSVPEKNHLGHTTSYTNIYQTGLLTRITDPLGQVTNFTYNAAGQVLTTQRYLGSTPLTTSYSYNGGSLASITDPLNRTTTFYQDQVGRTIRAIDPFGRVNQFSYDSLDRLTQTTDPFGETTQLSYDNNNNLLSVQDGRNNITQFSYDTRDRVSSKTDALTHGENYQYDAAGNLLSRADRKGQVTGYVYDALNRITSAGFGGTVANPNAYQNTIAYTWDAGNRLTQAVDSVSGTIMRQFDGLDRMTQEQSPQGQINYGYYANGLRQVMTVLGQTAINYSYDAGDHLTQLTQGGATVGLAYDSLNRRTTLTLPNGVQVSYGYDNASELTSLTYQKGSTTLGTLSYAYDGAGQRTSIGGSFAPSTLPAAVTTATYDASNHLTQWGSAALTYDANGNLTSDGTNTYTWNARNQLANISGATTASFQYDVFNRRIGKTINGTSTNFLNDGWQIVQELNGTTPTANLLTGVNIDEVFRRTAGSTTSDYLIDALGSTLALTDSTGTVQTSYAYEPYGKTTVTGAANSNAFQYSGRENDGTGLYYYRNRYYNPQFHRFISEDPIGFAGGINTGAYTLGNPIYYRDPSGNGPAEAVVGAVFGFGWGVVDGIIKGEDGQQIFEHAGEDALFGALTGLTDGLNLLRIPANMVISGAGEYFKQAVDSANSGCSGINATQIAIAALTGSLGDFGGDLSASAAASAVTDATHVFQDSSSIAAAIVGANITGAANAGVAGQARANR